MWKATMAAAILAAGGAAAQPISGDRADDLLFRTRGETIALAADLSEQDKAILRQVIELAETRLRQPLYWYSTIAFAPDSGLLQEPGPISAANHHGVAAADRAALAACDAARPAGSRPCRIAARVLPRGYEARSLELSIGATTAFRETYRRTRGEKALAISRRSGQFAIATGPGAAAQAVAQCNARSQDANDCETVIAD